MPTRPAYWSAERGVMKNLLQPDLDGSWRRGEMDLHYQPEFTIRDRKLVGFEALARWNHPIFGVVPPSSFIPIAEATGLIAPLGAWVLENACRRAAAWQKNDPSVGIAVNVSALQIARDDFVSTVLNTVERTGIAPGLLQLELTESALLTDLDQAAEKMQKLRAMRIAISIDDFGTGYSSSAYLDKLPFTTLKLDRSFAQDLGARSGAFVESVVRLAHRLGMDVVVEGIESGRQLRAARESGCDQVQGFLLGRPTSRPEAFLPSNSLITNADLSFASGTQAKAA